MRAAEWLCVWVGAVRIVSRPWCPGEGTVVCEALHSISTFDVGTKSAMAEHLSLELVQSGTSGRVVQEKTGRYGRYFRGLDSAGLRLPAESASMGSPRSSVAA